MENVKWYSGKRNGKNSHHFLNEYAWLLDRIRYYKKELGNLEQAVDAAISKLSEDSILKSFLLANKADVKRMCITEYNEEETMKSRIELLEILAEAEDDIKNGRTAPISKTFDNIRSILKEG